MGVAVGVAVKVAVPDSDLVLTAADARRLVACISRCPSDSNSAVTAVCTVVIAAILEVYREKLESDSRLEVGCVTPVRLRVCMSARVCLWGCVRTLPCSLTGQYACVHGVAVHLRFILLPRRN